KAAANAGAFAELARRLGDDSEDVRVTAAAALMRHGPDARSAGPEAARFVNEGDPETCVLAIRVLAAVKADAKVAVPALTKALGAKDVPVRLAAVKALAGYGTDAAPATEKLRDLMVSDPDAKVRQAVAAVFLDGVLPPKPRKREGPRNGPAEQGEPSALRTDLDHRLDA